MSLKLFDQLVTQYLDEYGNLITDNTTASAGMAATGGQGGAVGEAVEVLAVCAGLCVEIAAGKENHSDNGGGE